MALGTLYPAQGKRTGLVTLGGIVTYTTSGAVDSQTARSGFTVTKPAGTGLYRITLDHFYSELLAAGLVMYNGGTAADVDVQVSTVYAPTTGILDYETMAAGSAADPTSGHSTHIILLLNSSTIR